MQTHQMLINGQWVNAASGEFFDDYNPYTGEVFARVPKGDEKDAGWQWPRPLTPENPGPLRLPWNARRFCSGPLGCLKKACRSMQTCSQPKGWHVWKGDV